MSIVGSKAYHANNEVKLGNNNYLQREKNFSGYIMYHDFTGKYVNGWVYKNGKIKGTLSKQTGDDLKTELKMAVACSTYEITTYYEQCTLWYKDSNGDGKRQSDEYTNTTCKEYAVTSTYMECQPYFTDEGGGGYIPATDEEQPCNCVNTCPVCGGCLEPELKSAILPDSGSTPTVSCPECSCPAAPIVDADELKQNPKADCIYQKLLNGGIMQSFIDRYYGSTQPYHSFLGELNLTWTLGITTQTIPINAPANNTYYSVEIQLSENMINSYSSTNVALTMLHEALHAKLIAEYYDDPEVASTDFKNLYAHYKGWGLGIDKEQEKIMLESYFDELANALQSFDQSQGIYNTSDFYKRSIRYDLIFEIYGESSSQTDYNAYQTLVNSSKSCN